MKMNISVFKPNGRKFFMAQWVDPITGRKKTRSTETAIKRDAERFAGNLAKELESGTYHEDLRMTWEKFRERFEAEYVPGVAPGTGRRYLSTMNSFEKIISPKLLSSVNESTISRYQAECQKAGNAMSTVKSNLVHLRAILNWAVDQRFIPMAPKIRMPKNSSGMKGRPITGEEFDRLIKNAGSEEMRFLLRGLWWSGLRLGEALSLHWTDDRNLCVDLENELLIIQPHAQKKRKYTETPMAPEFVDLLQAVPKSDREGFVFKLPTPRNVELISKQIAEIGRKAGIKVSEAKLGKPKFATAHDLRRSFGFRWSRLIMPTELRELMRHANIGTTMEFYVGTDAKATAKRLREAVANTLANTKKKKANSESSGSP